MVKSKEKRKKTKIKIKNENEDKIISLITNTILIITTLLGTYNIYYVIKHPNNTKFDAKLNTECFMLINQIPLLTLGIGPVYYLFRIHGFFSSG